MLTVIIEFDSIILRLQSSVSCMWLIGAGRPGSGEHAQKLWSTQIPLKTCHNEKWHHFFSSVCFYFLPSVVLEINASLSTFFPFDIQNRWKHPLFLRRHLDWVMLCLKACSYFHLLLFWEIIFNSGEQKTRCVICESSQLSLPCWHQTFLIEPEVSGWVVLMPGAY